MLIASSNIPAPSPAGPVRLPGAPAPFRPGGEGVDSI
jgi:hypothetical protein